MTGITITDIADNKNEEIGKTVDLCVRQANDITVENQTDLDSAAVFVRGLKTVLKEIADTFDGPIADAHRAHKSMLTAKNKHADPVKKAESIVKGRIGKYQLEQERIRREEERRLRAQQEDRERKAREEEAERKRKVEEEEQARLAEAQRLEDEGRTSEAEAVLDAAPPEAPPIAAPEPLPAVAPARAPKAKGVSTTSVWKWEVVNIEMVPRNFMMIDEKALNAYVRAKKGDTRVPGISIREEKRVAAGRL